MRITAPEISFQDDSRGVSEVVGFLLIFAILVILLSINQAQFVPQENREVEFQHFQDVQDDMVDVRSAISTAGQTNISQYPTVRLGTNYPTRLFAINPPPPTGSLQTSQSYNISIYDDPDMNSDPQNVSTQFLEYQNGYNELDVGPIWYENSVLYLDERSNDGNIAVIEDQNLLTGNNDPVRITALQKNYTKSSTSRVAIEFYPAEDTEINLDGLEGDVTIEIPTRLNRTEYWDEELSGNPKYNGVTEDGLESGIHLLNLTVDVDALEFNTVGIDSEPEEGDSARQGIKTGDNGAEDGEEKTANFPRVAFVDDSVIQAMDDRRVVSDYAVNEDNVGGLGPPNADISGNGLKDIPFVNDDNDLQLVDTEGSTSLVDDSNGVNSVRIGVGDWDDSGVSLVYVRNGQLYTAEPVRKICKKAAGGSGNCAKGYSAQAVAGIADFDDDGKNDIIYLYDGDLTYIGGETDDKQVIVDGGVPENAVSTPADFDNDGKIEIAYTNGDGNIEIVDSSGTSETLATTYEVPAQPMGALDLTGDGTPDIIHKDGSGNMARYDVVNDTTKMVADNNGDPIRPGDTGVVGI